MDLLDWVDLFKLLELNKSEFEARYACIIDSHAISGKYTLDNCGDCIDGLSLLELETIRNWGRDLQLDLPCTPSQFFGWAERNGFTATLPDDFVPTIRRDKGCRYIQRDNDFNAWIAETKPDLNSMTKDDIHKALMKRNSLFISGFLDWWKQQQIHKGTAGRKKKLIK